MKVGVVGCGYWGNKHIHTLKELAVDIVTCDIDGTKDYQNSDVMYTTERLDAVTICVPHNQLAKETLRALKYKVPCLVEKPMATNSEDAWKIKATSYVLDVLVMPGFIERFNSNLHKTKLFTRKGPYPTDRNIIWDLLIHDLDLARYLGMSTATFDCSWNLQKERTFVDDGKSLERELKHFLACVNGYEEPKVTVDDGVQAVIIAEQIQRNNGFRN